LRILAAFLVAFALVIGVGFSLALSKSASAPELLAQQNLADTEDSPLGVDPTQLATGDVQPATEAQSEISIPSDGSEVEGWLEPLDATLSGAPGSHSPEIDMLVPARAGPPPGARRTARAGSPPSSRRGR